MNTVEKVNPAELDNLEQSLTEDIATLERKRADLAAVRRVKELLKTQDIVVAKTTPTTESTNAAANHTGNGVSSSPISGEVNDAVTAVVKLMDGTFTIRDIESAVEARGHKYVRSSMRAAMARMESRGEIVVDRVGQGRRATRYTLPKKNEISPQPPP